MLTDTELLTRVNSKNATYLVTINGKREAYPRQWINVDADNKKDAIQFGHEFALRILGLKRSDYYILASKNA